MKRWSTTVSAWSLSHSVAVRSPTRSFSSSRQRAEETTKPLPDLSLYPPSRIRNVCIVAHIDHGPLLIPLRNGPSALGEWFTDFEPWFENATGKSTLADRMLEMTGTIPMKIASRDRLEEDMKNEQSVSIKLYFISAVPPSPPGDFSSYPRAHFSYRIPHSGQNTDARSKRRPIIIESSIP